MAASFSTGFSSDETLAERPPLPHLPSTPSLSAHDPLTAVIPALTVGNYLVCWLVDCVLLPLKCKIHQSKGLPRPSTWSGVSQVLNGYFMKR